jgi:creatinine amidohydrolase/Fe(II)-dependent formamide hydrolase-like protein
MGRQVIILPIGSCEQHGPYLPLDTDLRIAELIANELQKKFSEDQSIKLPALPFSCSWEHQGPGMISLRTTTLANIIYDTVQSLKSWNIPFMLVLINWHGGNSILSSLTTEITAREKIPTMVFHTLTEASQIWASTFEECFDDVHAGTIETSIIQAYWPELLKEEVLSNADYKPDIASIPTQTAIQAFGIVSLTQEGIWGTPTLADHTKGKVVIDKLIDMTYEQIQKITQIIEQRS